jgi:hypothetical protein
MRNLSYNIVLTLSVFAVVIAMVLYWSYPFTTQSQRFYDQKTVYPALSLIHTNRATIIREINKLNSWSHWPEQQLIKPGGEWKIIPFYGFDTWVTPFCNMCPVLHSELKKITGLRTAILSRMSPGTVLRAHQGWASLSNRVLRIHYGIDVPRDCQVFVEGEGRTQHNGQFCVFDDSKQHWASNLSSVDRTVLILDIDRPPQVPMGVSAAAETPELFRIVEYYKKLGKVYE